MQRLVLALVLTLAAGCTTEASSSSSRGKIAKTSARLIGGATNEGDPAVVVFRAETDGECSAVFVSTTVLLTAAHCVTEEDTGKPMTNPVFQFYRGNDVTKATDADWVTVDPKNVHPHPGFKGEEHDIAVVVLDKPETVTPLALLEQSLSAADVGKPVRLIGYGANVEGDTADDDGFGLKRQLTTTIASLDKDFVQVGKKGQTACGGDSGGPALLMINGIETIIGLDSFSDATIDCTEGEFYQRVDAERAFIDPYLAPVSTEPAPAGQADSASAKDDSSSKSSDEATTKPSGPDAAACSIGRAPRASAWPFAIAIALGLSLARYTAKRRRSFVMTGR